MDKNYEGFTTMKKWMENLTHGKSFGEYFKNYGYRKIAIYGAGEVGVLLADELNKSDIKISYFIDRNAEGLNKINGTKVIRWEQIADQEKVDAVVVSVFGCYDEICRNMDEILPEVPTISLREAVYEV